jgi:hypothetical protein
VSSARPSYPRGVSTGWEAIDDAERRLDARSRERADARSRRARRRRWLPLVLALLVLPVAGAAALVALLESEDGDLGAWPDGRANAALAAAFLWPLAASAVATRRRPLLERMLWPLATVLVMASLTLGLAFVVLGLGPR